MMRWLMAAALAGSAAMTAAAAEAPATQPASTQPASIQPDSKPPGNAALSSQLAELDVRASNISDLSARFVQKKYTALLKQPLVSSGEIRASGNVIRWDTQLPERSVLYSSEAEFDVYYPSQNLEEIYPMDRRLADLLASPLPRMKAIADHFRIEPGDIKLLADPAEALKANTALDANFAPLVLRLLPTDPFIQQHVQEVVVVIDPQTALAAAMQTTDSDGDKTEMFFSNAKTNAGTKPGELALKVPAGTTVSHPLENGGSGGAPQP